MAGAGPETLRVKFVNANWTAGGDGQDGEFALLLITEDDRRHSVSVGPAAVSALLELVRDSPALLWDPDAAGLIAVNLASEWLPLDWSGRKADQMGRRPARRSTRRETVARRAR